MCSLEGSGFGIQGLGFFGGVSGVSASSATGLRSWGAAGD